MQAVLDRERIPYRETDNGFEAQECYVDAIRHIEAQYQEQPRSLRDKLRDDIERMLMMSKDFDELLQRLRDAHYEIKQGKYIAVRPENARNYIRLKSLWRSNVRTSSILSAEMFLSPATRSPPK